MILPTLKRSAFPNITRLRAPTMTHNVSESIIDSLTDVKMPHYAPLAQVSGSIDLNGTILPEY
ncbi:hypothetical protein, partial [Escherichia coli]